MTKPSHRPVTAGLGIATGETGVTAGAVASSDGKLYALTDSSRQQFLPITLANGATMAQLSFAVASPANATVQKTDRGIVVQYNSPAQATSQTVEIIVTNAATGKRELLQVPVVAIAPTYANTGNVSASGGQLTQADGKQIVFPLA